MIQKSSLHKTMALFLRNPTTTMYLAGISRSIGLAHTSVKHNLNILKKEGIIEELEEKKGSRAFPTYRAATGSDQYRLYKKAENYLSLLESGLVEHIEKEAMPDCIVLFGSFQRGEDVEGSDIDLYVQAKASEIKTQAHERILDRKIELHFAEDFRSLPEELRSNIINGIVLHGFLEAG
ncbi:MAG: nucleotidyltransferase domain-containing protein [archaeon]